MLIDPIVEEIHEIRRQMAAAHGNDLRRLGAYFMERQKLHVGRLVVPPAGKPNQDAVSSTAAGVQKTHS
jgi:hypothetical protein